MIFLHMRVKYKTQAVQITCAVTKQQFYSAETNPSLQFELLVTHNHTI